VSHSIPDRELGIRITVVGQAARGAGERLTQIRGDAGSPTLSSSQRGDRTRFFWSPGFEPSVA